MDTKSLAKELRELRVEMRLAARLTRVVLAELVRWSYESADIGDRVRRVSRTRRTLKLGALAVGLTSAGIAATRMHWHAQEDTPSTLQTPPTPVG
jgi:hypothetical protein